LNMKTFNKLTKAERAVALAKDVIRLIKTKRITPHSGIYFRVPSYSSKTVKEGDSVQTFLKRLNEEECDVCAIGACFVALVDKENKLDFDKSMMHNIHRHSIIHAKPMRKKLKSVFSDSQMGLIEAAFECYADLALISVRSPNYTRSLYAAVAWGCDIDGSFARLNAIMKNIIQNGGKFKP